MPWAVAGLVVPLWLICLWTRPNPNHEFFLQLLEQLKENLDGHDAEDSGERL